MFGLPLPKMRYNDRELVNITIVVGTDFVKGGAKRKIQNCTAIIYKILKEIGKLKLIH